MSSVIRYADQNVTEIERENVPEEVAVIPLRNAVVFPGVILPIFVGRAESVDLIEKIGNPGALVGLFTQKSPNDEEVDEQNLHGTGTLAEIHRVLPMGEGGFQVFLQGIQKIELINLTVTKPHLMARIAPLGEIQDVSEEQYAEFQEHVIRYVENHPGIPGEVTGFIKRLKNPSALANQILFFSQRKIGEKIRFLMISSVSEKIAEIQKTLIEDTNRLRMEKEVHDKVEKDTNKIQREFYLRKQLETIRKELGDTDTDDTDELEKQLREKNLPEAFRKAVDKELIRLRKLTESPSSGGMEASQLRNWLELIAELPFEEADHKEVHLKEASQILDEDHEGLDEVKTRILEYLAVEKQTDGSKGPILCLVGPPGVGKTSLARSVARAMNRPMVRAALGGMRDEAEIRGHRRTYVGALPGKIIAAMKKAETTDPVFLLDEIDKTGSSYQGDPSSALLEVLDPEQNNTFEDHYVGIPYDLSKVLFIATANNIDTVPAPLLDRMEVVHLSGYTVEEKKAIARNHLLPDILTSLKLEKDQIDLTDAALERIIHAHTREAGVRSLKRKLESVARKTVRKMLEEIEQSRVREENTNTIESPAANQNHEEIENGQAIETEKTKVNLLTNKRVRYDSEDIGDILGRDRFFKDVGEDTGIPGVAIGLAWTPVGGDILYIEATSYPGKGDLKLSGKLGDVMKESAYTALSYLRANSDMFSLSPKLFTERDIHIHIPSGAIPKDGPSAGVTLLTALTSLLTGCPVTKEIAMTGEASLRGRILPVGGIKEKVLAARAAEIYTVLLPEKNRPEYEEIPEHVREGINVEYYNNMMDLLKRTVPEAFLAREQQVFSGQKNTEKPLFEKAEMNRDGW